MDAGQRAELREAMRQGVAQQSGTDWPLEPVKVGHFWHVKITCNSCGHLHNLATRYPIGETVEIICHGCETCLQVTIT
jgi:hypothetical protein